MRIKMLISLLMSAICFSACADIPSVKEPVPADEMIIAAPPEGGWTAEELMASSYLFGVQLEYPLTFRKLGSGFSPTGYFGDVNSSFINNETGDIWFDLQDAYQSNDDLPSSVYVSFGARENTSDPDMEIAELECFSYGISVNGVKYHSPKEDIEKLLGAPDEIARNEEYKYEYYKYYNRENGALLLTLRVNEESGLVTSINLSLK